MATYAPYDWAEVADDLAQHWFAPLEATEQMAWDNVREAVRFGWEQARRKRSREGVDGAPSRSTETAEAPGAGVKSGR